MKKNREKMIGIVISVVSAIICISLFLFGDKWLEKKSNVVKEVALTEDQLNLINSIDIDAIINNDGVEAVSEVDENPKQNSAEQNDEKSKALADILILKTMAEKERDEAYQLKVELKKIKEQLDKNKAALVNSSVALNKVCINYGPMSLELKNKFLDILNAEGIKNSFGNVKYETFQLPQYEIYWSLGTNRIAAIEKFEEQKSGALKDEKFKLTKEANGSWIIPATTVASDYAMADKLADQLNESSSQYGGKWEIREKLGGYYFSFPDAALIRTPILMRIEHEIRVPKSIC